MKRRGKDCRFGVVSMCIGRHICLLVWACPSILHIWHLTLMISWQAREWGLLLFSNEVIAWMSYAMPERSKPTICYPGMLYEWLFWPFIAISYKNILLSGNHSKPIVKRLNKLPKRTCLALLTSMQWGDVGHNRHFLLPFDLCCKVCDLFWESKMW